MKRNAYLALFALLSVSMPGCSGDSGKKIPDTRDIGLVLSSGGCKGAYHIGVWRALSEAGISRRIGVISGTSVGALCSALFANVRDHGTQVEVWKETSGVFRLSPPRENVERIYRREAAKKLKWYGVSELSAGLTNRLWAAAERQAMHEMIPLIARACVDLSEDADTTNLLFGAMSPEIIRRRLESVLPDPLPVDMPVVYATALKCGKDRELKAFRLDKLDRKTGIDALCASAAIPVAFPPVEIDGALWQDGSWETRGGDTTPIDPVLKNHGNLKIVMIVYLQNEASIPAGYRNEIRRKVQAAGMRLVEIIPSKDIGGPLNGWFGVFDSTAETMENLMRLGYSDAKRVLKNAF